ncbi:MAG TPA: hypothetical protein VFO94_05230 [Gammaproteobacteria bacterium]|nr:hypothetical protein [Gammaproteobacteria bacterium]
MRRLLKVSLLLVVLAAVLLVMLLSASIYTYHALTNEALIAELTFDRADGRIWVAHLRTGDRCTERELPLYGDQWRIDAEFLKWKSWANLLGLDAQYRLDRLEGRYRTAAEQNNGPNVAHDLGGSTAVDVVELAGALGSWNFLVDATYGSSVYHDIDTASLYSVYRTQTGIITRVTPRPPADASTPIKVTRGCDSEPPLWRRVSAWTDDRVVEALRRIDR